MSGNTPAARAIAQIDALYGAQTAPKSTDIKAISRKTRVPVNVLVALDEGRGDLKAVEANATRIAQAVEAGKPIEDAIFEIAGDEARGRAILDTAYDLADQMEPPAPAAADSGNDGRVGVAEGVAGIARDFGSGMLRAGGGALEAAGVVADEAVRGAFSDDPSQATPLRGAGRAAGDVARGAGEGIAEGRSEDYQRMREGTQPGGSLADPSSWSLGDDPSLLGLAGLTAEGLGSMAPVVAAGVLTKSPALAGSIVGGLMGGGEGVETGRQFVQDAAKTLDENGRPVIEGLPEYQKLREAGTSHDRAVADLTRRAENEAGFRQGMVAGLGGAATNRILMGADGWLGRGGRLARAGKKGAASALEEGAQETAEGVAGGLGIEAATGANVDLMEDSFGDFVAGSLAGGAMGAGAGALGRGTDRPDPQPDTPPAPPERLALPAPENGGTIFGRPPSADINPAMPLGLPSPTNGGTIIPPAPAPRQPGEPEPVTVRQTPDLAGPSPDAPAPLVPAGGSSLDQTAAPSLSPSLGAGAAAPDAGMGIMPVPPVAPPAPPAGPVEAIAQSLAASMPAPVAEPAPWFPDQKPGATVLLGSPEGANENAVFLRETPTGAVVRIQGQEVELTPEAFDAARNQAEVNQNREETPRGDLGGNSVAASVGAKKRTPIALSVEEEFARLDPEQAKKRLEGLTAQAKQRGWDARRRNLRTILEGRIALGGPANVEPTSAEDGPEGGPAPAGVDDVRADSGEGAAARGVPDQEGAQAPGGMDREPGEGATRPEPVGGAVGGLDVAGDTGKLGGSLTAARAAGLITHTTKKGKAKTGYVLQGVTKAEADAIDPYSFKKDGGVFVNADRADAFAPVENTTQSNPEVLTVAAAAAQVAPAPTEAQKAAGNYKKGHARWNGLDLSIETAKGQERAGTGPDGKPWSVTMPADYGYFRKTEGADGDHVDFYMGPNEAAPMAFVVDQIDRKTKAFDEHKVIIGANDQGEALNLYRKGFSDGNADQRIGGVTAMPVADLKAWLASGDTKKPLAARAPEPIKKESPAPALIKTQNLKRESGITQTSIPAPSNQTRKSPPDFAQSAGNTKNIGDAPASTGVAAALSDADQARMAELKKKLADRLRNQANSGLDPELLGMAVELTGLYVKGGIRKFGAMLRDFMADTGLTARESQRYMRAAYNDVRDNADLNGEDVSAFDTADQVMAEVRAALAEPETAPGETAMSQESPEGDSIGQDTQPEGTPDDRNSTDEGDGRASPDRGPQDPEAGPERAEGSRQRRGRADAGQSGPEPDAGRSGGRRDDARDGDGRGDGRAVDGQRLEPGRNHVIPEGGLALKGGDKTRARAAVKAIEIVRDLEREGRPATDAERQQLAQYGGAGVLAPALPNSAGKIRMEDIAADLDRLLTPEERATIEKTSQYAFYTAEPVLRNMWALAQRLGFTGGQVFEPGMGVGGFAGTMPKSVFGQYSGIELDHITAKIAAALYPQSHIKHGDFIQTPMPRDFYDLVIGNPPFSQTKITADPAYPQGFMIHDYFFAKSLDSVRPGGLLMFVTSAGTMNKRNTKARDYLADRADLVGAIRLPNTAFAENGTQVTTDIIVLRKRLEGEAEANPAWRESTLVTYPDGKGGTVDLAVNRYFQENPEMILGEQGAFDTLVGAPRIGVRPREGANLARDLRTALESFPERVMSAPSAVQMMDGPRDATSAETKTGSYYLKDGELWQFDGREGKPVQRKGKSGGGMTKGDYELITQLVPIRNALRAVYAADLAETDATAARAELNRLYDAFVEKNGPLNKVEESYRRPSAVELEGLRQRAAEDARSAGLDFDTGSFDAGPLIEAEASMAAIARARREAAQEPGYREGTFNPDAVPDKVIEKFPNMDPFRGDPESFRLRAIEKFDRATGQARKTRVFTENAVKKATAPKINSPEDALLHQLADTGRIDIDRIAEASGSTPERVRAELKGKVFENPATGEMETRTRYLSGNVRRKLAEAQAAIARDIRFAENVAELEKVIPDPIPRSGIVVPLGAHWFDHGLYGEFAKSKGLTLQAEFKRALGQWIVDGDKSSAPAKNEWGTEDVPFAEMMRRAMNNKPMRVSRTVKNEDGSTTTFVDEEATQAAADKATELRTAFADWLWSDEARAEMLEERYNEAFNAEVAPVYDGAYLTTPGINAGWTWRPHQTAVVARILQSGSTYMAHAVGAGKTSAMIGAGMEARRLGLAQRPWYSVPNHMLVQFATEFQEQYPLANILVADENNFQGDRRRQFVADAASGDYDAVIITHSAFELIPSSPAAKAAVVEGMLADLRELIQDQSDNPRDRVPGQDQATLGALKSVAAALGIKEGKKDAGDKVSTAKKIAQMMEQAEQRLTAMTQDTGKDEVFTFDEIGVDMLFVDEAHLFRKLSFATTNGSIKGIDPKGSSMSMDLYIKSRSVDRRNPGRGLVFASGTPITNTMAELFSLQRFMQPQALDERNISAFDAWAATFGEVASELEQTPDGGYKEVSRFSKFVNTPELSLMVRQVMDIVTSADLEKYVTRPQLRGGGRNLIVIESSPEQKAFQRDLAARMRAMQQRKGKPKPGDDIMLNVVNDGRLAAIDMRLVDPTASGEGSKLERMIQNVYQGWKAGADAPLHGVKPEGGYTAKPVMRGPSTQIVFSTLGVNPSKHNPSFSVHRHIKASLIRMGVPESDIIMAGDLKSHLAKQRAFNDMNEGKRRILIGSKSIFTGVNAQRRLAQIHNLDPLWFPADDEQRNGRGIRQGNMNPEIAINDYSTKGTYDATMWQMMGRKAAFIEGFYRGDPTMRDMEDLGEASAFEQAKAMTTSDPRILQLTELKTERDKLRRRAGAVDTQRSKLRAQIRSAMRGIEFNRDEARKVEPITGMIPDLSGDKFKMRVGATEFDSRKEAGEAIMARVEALAEAGKSVSEIVVGNIGGFPVEADWSELMKSARVGVRHSPVMDLADAEFSDDPVGLVRKLEHALKKPERYLEFYQAEGAKAERQAAALRTQLEGVKEFADQAKLDGLETEIDTLQAALVADAAAAEAEGNQDGQVDAPQESRFTDKPVATLTGDEVGDWSDMRDLGMKAEAWYRENLVGTTVTNAETGMVIGFNRRGAKKISGRKGDKLYRMVPALREMLANGSVISTEADRESRRQIKAVIKIAATVNLDGNAERVIVVVREMQDGTFHYDLSMDRGEGNPGNAADRVTEARSSVPGDETRGFSTPTAEDKSSASALEGGPADLNMEIEGDPVNGSDPDMTPAQARRINAAARAELEKVGIAGAVRAEAGGEGRAAGTYQRGVIRILRTRAGKWRHTLDHEILHALRDPEAWSGEAGLFTRAEWSALARAARADKAVRERVEAAYPDLTEAGRTEEMVAEFYADWAQGNREAPAGPMANALGRIRSFFNAVASALRGEGFQDAASIMRRIAKGEVGGRGPDGPGTGRGAAREQRNMDGLTTALREGAARTRKRSGVAARALFSREAWSNSPEVFSNFLTDAMGRNQQFNLLGAVPGYSLFKELGKNLSAAQTYLGLKQSMDAERNDWQARAAAAVDEWTKIGRKDRESNTRLMDLMHESTLAGIDPSKTDDWRHPHLDSARRIDRADVASPEDRAFAARVAQEIADHEATYDRLKRQFDALPADFQSLYGKVRDEYATMADATDQAVLDNVKVANELALKRAQKKHKDEMQRIKDEGLTGAARDEAVDQADRRLAATQKRARDNGAARMASLRAAFETNRLKGPYFPLARFGSYFVTVRDADGAVISFSRFEKKAQQEDEVARAEKEGAAEGWTVTRGVLGGDADLKGMVDPRFVSEVEGILSESDASPETMDAIWQHWLESLPDLSVRKSRIHRKGRSGFNKDAVRAFSSAMFHGAHNLARLRYGLRMDDALNEAEAQAGRQADPERAGFVVREMRQRHNFTMKPTNNPLVTAGTSLAFVWYLGMSPASALVNISQTTVFGVPILRTAFPKAGVTGATKALGKAAADFGRGKGWTERSKNLTEDERAAIQEGYRRGTIDKTQAHDLAAVAESGVAYNPTREKVMRTIGFMFHHAERLNREVTFLAAYRLARADGRDHDASINDAADLTWRTHFDYQNTARPRMMQGDFEKIIFTFRNFTVNALYRLFRDTHQAFAGATAEERREARGQLVGVSLSMMAHAGIKGVWGYGMLMALLGAVMPGGDGDDIEDWLQDALLMEGDDLGTAAWNWAMGMVLHGVPGTVTGTSLTERLGMPSLWFRPPREGTEGQDVWAHYLEQFAGPVVGIGGQFMSGLSMIGDAWSEGNGDNLMRGAEKLVPNFVSNGIIKPARFMTYGANSYYGDPLMEVGPLDAVRTAMGFTPAELAERYQINARLKAREREITGRRARIHRLIGKAMQDGGEIPARVMRDMQEFNREFPEYPITRDTIRQSIRSRARAKERNEFGVTLNSKLNDRLRGEMPTPIYN